MSQMPPPQPYQPYPSYPMYGTMPPPPPKRKGLPLWLTITLITVAAVVVFGGVAALFVYPSLARLYNTSNLGPTLPSQLGPSLPAQMGQSLVINGVTVTLESANSQTNTDIFGGQYKTLTIELHCWNQTAYGQSVSMSNWKLLIRGTPYTADSSNVNFSFPQGSDCPLDPNQTRDVEMSINMDPSLGPPYDLQSDYTTPQGTPLAWSFSA